MILADTVFTAAGADATLDALFRRAGVRAPDAIALVDPPDKQSFAGGVPRKLTYAETDRAISAMAARLHGLGLRADAVVALQLANTVESVIALLGVLRAGMIAAPLPYLWRQQEIVTALRGTGAKAIVTQGAAPAQSAMLAAVELFPVRHVCAFGGGLPDGVVALDDVFENDASAGLPAAPRPGPAAAHVALVSFEVTAAGIVPRARNHAQLMAAALSVFLEAGIAQEAAILSALPASSFAGVALTVLPWLLAGGALTLHHTGDARALAAQCAELGRATLMLPGAAVTPLAAAGALGTLEAVVALWRAPERMAGSPAWTGDATLVDVASFGEIGLCTARRGADGLAAPLPHGVGTAPQKAAGAIAVAETARTATGTLALGGPVVPVAAFPPGAAPLAETDGFIDTGFTCRIDGNGLLVTGPPAGLAGIGGYRFHPPTLEAALAAYDPDATLLVVPDALLGQRLAGSAPDQLKTAAALQESGHNPLLAGAFRPRRAA